MPKLVLLTPEQRKRGNVISQQVLHRRMPRKEVCVNKRRFWLYSVAWLGALAKKSPRTIHRLERIKVMPRPIYDLGDGYRWYTAGEIMGYSRLIAAAGLKPGRHGNGAKRSDWLKVHAFAFRAKLKETLKVSPELVKNRLDQEAAILKELSTYNRIRFTEQDIIRLITE